jgi:hypothetical protein
VVHFFTLPALHLDICCAGEAADDHQRDQSAIVTELGGKRDDSGKLTFPEYFLGLSGKRIR